MLLKEKSKEMIQLQKEVGFEMILPIMKDL